MSEAYQEPQDLPSDFLLKEIEQHLQKDPSIFTLTDNNGVTHYGSYPARGVSIRKIGEQLTVEQIITVTEQSGISRTIKYTLDFSNPKASAILTKVIEGPRKVTFVVYSFEQEYTDKLNEFSAMLCEKS